MFNEKTLAAHMNTLKKSDEVKSLMEFIVHHGAEFGTSMPVW